MKNMGKKVISLFLFVLLFSMAGIAAAQELAPVKIGVIISLTGEAAEMGAEDQDVLGVAVDLINGQGGINGHPVEVNIVNGESKPAVFSLKAHRLLEEDILIGLGGNDISFATAAGQVFQDAKTAFLDLGGTTPTIPLVGDFMFMTPIPDNDQGRAIAKYVVDKLGYDTVTIFKDVGSSYGTMLTDYLVYYLKEFTGKDDVVPFIPSYNLGDKDFTAQITRLQGEIKKYGIQAIILPTWPEEAPIIAKQCRDMGIDLPFIGSDGTDTSALTEVGGKAVEGMLVGTHFDAGMGNLPPAVKEFTKAYEAKYSAPPGAFGTMAYDGLMICVESISLVINEKGEEWWAKASVGEKRLAIKDALYKVKTTKTTQPISFDEQGFPKRGLVWKEVKNGKTQYLDFISYEEYTPEGINLDPQR